jgi:hypothetical protein
MMMVRIKYFVIYSVLTAILLALQLFLQADPLMLALAFLALLSIGIILLIGGVNRVLSILALLIVTQYSFLPFWIKTFIWQRLDLGLNSPYQTLAVAATGSFVVVVALALVQSVPSPKRKIIQFDLSDKQISLLGALSFLAGFILTAVHIAVRPTILSDGSVISGFGGFGQFSSLLYLGMICVTYAHIRNHSTGVMSVPIFLILAGSLLLSLLDNVKLYFTLTFLAYAITIYFNKQLALNSISVLKFVVIYSVIMAAYFQIVVPVIQIVRTDRFRTSAVTGRIEEIFELLSSDKQNISNELTYIFEYKYFPGLHSPIVDRLEMIHELDLVTSGARRQNRLEWQPVIYGVTKILPSFLVPNKPNLADVDLVSYQIGYTPYLRIIRKTYGVFAVSYAMFLWPGWIFVTFFLVFSFFLSINTLIDTDLKANVFGVFILIKYGLYVTSASVESLIIMLFREIPIDIVSIFILVFLTRAIVQFPRMRFALS